MQLKSNLEDSMNLQTLELCKELEAHGNDFTWSEIYEIVFVKLKALPTSDKIDRKCFNGLEKFARSEKFKRFERMVKEVIIKGNQVIDLIVSEKREIRRGNDSK